MRLTRSFRPRRALLLFALLAACGDDGGTEPVAQLHQLRLDIIEGKGIRDTVRAPGDPEDAATSRAVVVRVYPDVQRSVQARPGGAGPSLDVRIPPVEIRWRTLEPWCRPERTTSSITRGDTASVRIVLPVVADYCRLQVEGVLNGNVFGTDTAVVEFSPGALAGYRLQPLVIMITNSTLDVRDLEYEGEDVHGNYIENPELQWELTAGLPQIRINDLILTAAAEGEGTMRVTGAGSVQTTTLWSLFSAEGAWRITWSCYDAALPGGAQADSAHFTYFADSYYGQVSPRGLGVGLRGVLTTRLWVRGEPMRETVDLAVTRHAAQRPRILEWSPGQEATRTGRSWTGGSLCESLPGGGPWARFAPVRAELI